MTRQTIGESLAVRLYAAEAAIDRAMAETAALTAALPAARAEAYLSAVTGQRAFSGAAATIAASSHTSRTAACSQVSPGSSLPLGNDQSP